MTTYARRPFQRRVSASPRPTFKNPVPCRACSGRCYDGDDHCIACNGWGELEGPPPPPAPPAPRMPHDPAQIARLETFIIAHAAYLEAISALLDPTATTHPRVRRVLEVLRTAMRAPIFPAAVQAALTEAKKRAQC